MSEKLVVAPAIKTSNVSKLEKAACPNCDASLKFYRSEKPHIDECGFESYSLKCSACGSAGNLVVTNSTSRLAADA